MRCVITGANRGIGLEFVRQLLARKATVIAAVREPSRADALRALAAQTPERLTIVACDVASDASVKQFAESVGPGGIELLVNNAGVYGNGPQSADNMDFERALETYSINALGPLRVTLALRRQLALASPSKVIHVSSGMGSIEDNRSGGDYGYRMSKAALNMASRSLAIDLRGDGIMSAVINPGWVQTDMGGAGAAISVSTSVTAMLKQIDGLTTSGSGSFLDWKGGQYPW